MNCMCVYVLSVIATVSLTQAVSRSLFFIFVIGIHHVLILLGHIDHDIVHMISASRQKYKLCKPAVRTLEKCTSKAVDDLSGIFRLPV